MCKTEMIKRNTDLWNGFNLSEQYGFCEKDMIFRGIGGICNAGEERHTIYTQRLITPQYPRLLSIPHSLHDRDGSLFQQIFIKALSQTRHCTNTLHLGSWEKINMQSTILIVLISWVLSGVNYNIKYLTFVGSQATQQSCKEGLWHSAYG